MMKRRFTNFQTQAGNKIKSESNGEVKKKESTKKVFANPLRCGICSGTLRKPKFLSCFHTFCVRCLVEYAEKKKTPDGANFPCPLCLVPTEIPPEGVLGLSDNLYVLAYDAVNASKNLCQLCETGKSVVARCGDCDDIMCMACKNVHQKMKATRNHKIVLLAEQEKILNSSLSQQCICPDHPGEEVCSVCTTCNKLICEVCKFYHFDHKLEDASEVAKTRKEEISRLADGVRSYLPYIKNNMTKADKETKRLTEDVEKTKQTITDTANRLKNEIDAACARKISDADATLKKCLLSIDKFHAEMERAYLSIKTLAIMSDQIIDLAPGGLLLQTNHSLGKRLESIPTEIPACSLVSAKTKFSPKDVPTEDMLGDTHVSVLAILKFSPADKTVPMFYCPGRPYSICPVSDDEAWVICDTPETIQLYSKHGVIRKFLKLPGEVNDVCSTSNGSLFVTELRGRAIWKISNDNSVKPFTTIEDTVRGVCSYDGKFYVTRKFSDNHMVAVLAQDTGEIEKEIAHDNGSTIFCHPDRIVVTSTGTICVTDRGEVGAVVFVTADGCVVSSYKGKGDGNGGDRKGRFEPWGLCVDQHDNVFVSDRFNDTIHVLDGKGVFRKYLLTEDDGIKRPLGVAVDTAGHLWVGNEDGCIHVFGYLELL